MEGLRTAMMSGPAGRWVRLVWEWPGYRSAAAAERILPHGLIELTWDLNGSMAFDHGGRRRDHAGPVVIGPHTSAYVVDTGRPQHLFGILFAPGAAAALLGCSASDLLDRTEPWSDFHAAPGLGQRLGDAPNWPARRAIVHEHFASLDGPVLPVGARRLLQVWREAPSASVRSVAALAGISAPTLSRHTRRAFGMAPAQLRRVWRFRRSLELWSGGHESSLAGLAHAAGYADQAHLTREFGAFAGITPSQYTPLLEGHAFNVAAPTAFISFKTEPAPAGSLLAMATHSLTYFVATTLDGFIAHPDGSWDGFLGEGDHLQALQEEMADFDTVLMGRRTYEVGLAAGLEPGQPAYPPLRQIVYGRGIELPAESPIEVVSEGAVDHVRGLKAVGGVHWLCGGSVFAGSLARAGLIDRLVVKLNPVAFGAGLPLFDRLEGQLSWSLEGTRAFESGVVFLRYSRS